MKAQRLRLRYSLGVEATELGQRELVTAWEQAFDAAGLPLARSQGRRPSAELSVAAPLPRGVTSDFELLDVFLADRVPVGQVAKRLTTKLPSGLGILAVEEVGLSAPSLQSQVRWAQYELRAEGVDESALRRAIEDTLDARSLPSQYRRENKLREYDLRPLIIDLGLSRDSEGSSVVIMRLRAEPERTARADQVAAALHLPDEFRIHRTRLMLEEVSPVLLAFRRAGERHED